MKLMEIYYNSDMPAGTYVGVRFDADTKKRIMQMMAQLKLKNPIPEEKLHSTLVYSDKKSLEGFTSKNPAGYKAKPKGFNLFDNSQKSGSKCLVMELDCDDLHSRHSDIVGQYGVEEKFPEYKPHVTLSYDYDGEVPDESLLDQLGEIGIESEYDEPINDNFAKSL